MMERKRVEIAGFIVAMVGALATVIGVGVAIWSSGKFISAPPEHVARGVVDALLESREQAGLSVPDVLADKEQRIRELTSSESQRKNAEAALARGEIGKADAIFKQIEKGAAHQAAEVAKTLGAIAYRNRPQGALEHYRRAVAYAPEDAEAWNKVGKLNYRLGEMAAAEAAFRRARELGEAAEDKRVIAMALNNLGVIARTRGDLAKAEGLHRRALALIEKLGHKKHMAVTLSNLGEVARARGDLNEAERIHRRALNLHEELGHKQGMANRLTNLGNIAQTRGKSAKAEAYHQRALALAEEAGHKEKIAIVFGNLGVVTQDRGQLDKAEEYFERALMLNEELGHKQGMATTLRHLGLLAETRGQRVEAEEYGRRALALFTEVGMKPEIDKVTGWLQRLGTP
uniref:Tetratricopeptide repeat-containing protein n=1 Tax=Candidatus Kentrum sp. MB TaxID=2138164 RepID=A0A450X002_9GAMM|nr:MAG: Tetratricopeptide repeat-containing protein [Candidatus Kentron sp. MB]VFK28903.1 MAG: Tetratricopeptide repeat-containing protein [Candidatus Kentron sp. MB]VFK74148.1 MAG: Tetratricopeptide repeat-containing protein [Candidatus Kentron sp. MB]